VDREQVDIVFAQATGWFVAAVPNVVAAIIIFIVGYALSRWMSGLVKNVLGSRQQIDQTLTPVLAGLVRYLILIVTLVAVLGQLGVQIASMLAVIGAAGLAIGLALQGTLSNIAAGLMLLWLRPFRVGDAIEADGGIAGTVTELGLFASTLKTGEGVFRFVPNSSLWNKSIVNFSRNPQRRMDLVFTLKRADGVGEAKSALLKLASDHPHVLQDPAPRAVVSELGDGFVKVMLRAWAATPDYWNVRWELSEQGSAIAEAANKVATEPA